MNPLRESLITKDNINQVKVREKLRFDKDCLETGTCIMLKDKTFGMFLKKDMYSLLSQQFQHISPNFSYFVCSEHNGGSLTSNIISYDETLHHEYHNMDIVRIYYDLFPKNDITKNFLIHFKKNIEKFVKDKKYIER